MPSRTRSFLAAGIFAAVAGIGTSGATATLSREEALRSAYPGAKIRAEQVFLTAAQQREAEALSGVAVPTQLVVRYLADQAGELVGRAYVDSHTVRTKKETLLVSLDRRGVITRIDVTAFLEPPEYQASEAWLRQYGGRPLSEDLRVQRAIRPLAGATLTARSANDAVRRVLAIDQVLEATRTIGR